MTTLNTTIFDVKEYLVIGGAIDWKEAGEMAEEDLVVMAQENGMFDGNCCDEYTDVIIDGINIDQYIEGYHP